jgi:thiol:disulfide interchange protein DsbA
LRKFSACLAALLLACAAAQAAPPVAGRDYQLLEPPRPAPREKIEVIEFFWYGCPVCYEAQPRISRWLKDAGTDVLLRRVPAVNSEGWEPFARAYYALESLQAVERLHWPLYDNHHFDDRRLEVESNLVAWVGANGIEPERFKAALHSIDTRQKVEFARRMLGTYGVRGVPSIVVDGRYVTSARMAGGTGEMMAVVEHLVGLARQERAKK